MTKSTYAGMEFIWNDDHLKHFGVPGQRWGFRRWQNLDGSLTQEGREHYGVGDARQRSKSAENLENRRKQFYDSVQALDAKVKKTFKNDRLWEDKDPRLGTISALYNNVGEKATVMDMIRISGGYIHGDYDQGLVTSSSIGIYETGKYDKALEYAKEYSKLASSYINESIPKFVDEMLEEASRTVPNASKAMLEKMIDVNKLTNQIANVEMSKIDEYLLDKMDFAGRDIQNVVRSAEVNIDKSKYNESKKLADMFYTSASSDLSGWQYYDQAIKELGLSSLNYDELTAQDAKQINAKVAELRK